MWLYVEPDQHMKPLTTEQEVLLASDDQNDSVKEDGNAGGNVPEDTSLESSKGTYKDSSSPEFDETPSEIRVGDDSDSGSSSVQDVEYASNVTDAINNASIQEDLQNEPTFDNKSVSPETSSVSLDFPESKNFGDSFVGGTEELSSELTETPFDVKPTNLLVSDGNPSDLNTEPQDEMRDSSFSTMTPIVNEPVALNVSVNSQSDSTFDTQNLPKNDLDTLAPPSTEESPDLSKTTLVSAEKNSSSLDNRNYSESELSENSRSEFTYPLANDANYNNEMNKSRSESSNLVNSFSSAGIPAPSVVSAALQVLPGKVLVPATVDQVQGQALAALQVLKVLLCPNSCISCYFIDFMAPLCIAKVELYIYLFEFLVSVLILLVCKKTFGNRSNNGGSYLSKKKKNNRGSYFPHVHLVVIIIRRACSLLFPQSCNLVCLVYFSHL